MDVENERQVDTGNLSVENHLFPETGGEVIQSSLEIFTQYLIFVTFSRYTPKSFSDNPG